MFSQMEATAALSQPEKMGELGRLTGVIWSPGTAFQDIAARPRFWPPLVLIVLMSLIFTYSFTQRVGWESFFRHQFETNTRMQQMPADQREQLLTQQVKWAPIFAYAASVVMTPVGAVIVAGVFLFVFRILLGAELKFRPVFAVVCYAMLPLVLSTLMALAVMFLKEPSEFDLQYPTLTNIGAFLDPLTTPKWLLSLGTSIDIFTLWILALLATGLAVAAARKISFASSLTAVAGTWAVYVLLKMGWAAMFG